MGRPSASGAAKRALSPPNFSPRKKLSLNVERLRDLHQESVRLQAEISASVIDALSAAAIVPPVTSPAPPVTVSEKVKPGRTLFDFNFSKSTLIPAADGTTKVVTVNSAAAAEGTTINSVVGNSSLKPSEVKCMYANKGCKKVMGNNGAATQHHLFCPFRRVRQTSIRASASSLSLFQRPQVVVEDADKQARTSSSAVAEKIAALPQAKRDSLKFRKNGHVDLRSLSTGGTAKRQKYSCLFKARLLRELDSGVPVSDVINKYSPDPFHPLQETMVIRLLCMFACFPAGAVLSFLSPRTRLRTRPLHFSCL